MSTKVKAFIGITISFVILIILFASNGGYRAARAAEESNKSDGSCAALQKCSENEICSSVETK